MSTFTFGSTTVTIDPAYRALGGAMRGMAKNVFSFQVKKLDEGQWYLITNRQNFIGRYPSQVAAISVLYGIMTFNDGLDSGVEAWLNESITSGSSEIDPDVNIIQFSTSAVETIVSVSEYDAAQALLSSGAPNDGGGYFLGYQLSSDGITWDAVNVSNVIGAALTGDVNQTRTSSGSTVWDNITENQYYRGVLMVADSGLTFYVASTSSIGVKDEVDDTDLTALTMVISGNSTEGDAVTLGGYAYSVVDASGAILDPGETISYTYNWYREIPTLTSLTSS